MLSIAPIGDRLLVKPDDIERETLSGLMIPNPESTQEYPAIGVVVMLPKMTLPGFDDPNDFLEVGDRIMFDRYAGDAVKIGEEEFKVLILENIYAILLPNV